MKNISDLSEYMTLMVGASVSAAAADVKEGFSCIENTNTFLLIDGYENAGALEKRGYVDRKDCEKPK